MRMGEGVRWGRWVSKVRGGEVELRETSLSHLILLQLTLEIEDKEKKEGKVRRDLHSTTHHPSTPPLTPLTIGFGKKLRNIASVVKHVIRGVSVSVIVIDFAQALSSSCCGCGECAPRNATESEPLAQAEPLSDDGPIAGLPL